MTEMHKSLGKTSMTGENTYEALPSEFMAATAALDFVLLLLVGSHAFFYFSATNRRPMAG